MGVHITPIKVLRRLLPANILSLGYPEGLGLEGSTLTCIDSIAHTGKELIADLNRPQWFGTFDLVIDPGTIEHCVNIWQALCNAAMSVKKNGHILHNSPLTMVNHGYYNICPVLYRDFYQANGFEVMEHGIVSMGNYQPVDSENMFDRKPCDNECAFYLVAQRKTDSFGFNFPSQGLYRS
jgi:hypothetical protein